jgi:hypothetical protein
MKKRDLPYMGFFWTAVMITLVILAVRAWQLSPLLVNKAVRTQAEESMRRLERDRGWLLSDISVRSVSSDNMRIVYRPHLRGTDPKNCYIVSFPSSAVEPCNSAR